MFDNNSFSRSELYFTTLQLLRTSSKWVSGGIENLESLAEALAWFYGALSDFPKRIPDDQTIFEYFRSTRTKLEECHLPPKESLQASPELNREENGRGKEFTRWSMFKQSSTYTYHSC
jgi:hypothetical protein